MNCLSELLRLQDAFAYPFYELNEVGSEGATLRLFKCWKNCIFTPLLQEYIYIYIYLNRELWIWAHTKIFPNNMAKQEGSPLHLYHWHTKCVSVLIANWCICVDVYRCVDVCVCYYGIRWVCAGRMYWRCLRRLEYTYMYIHRMHSAHSNHIWVCSLIHKSLKKSMRFW